MHDVTDMLRCSIDTTALCEHGVDSMRWAIGTLAGITACSMVRPEYTLFLLLVYVMNVDRAH